MTKRRRPSRTGNLGYRLGYRLHGSKPPTDVERVSELIDQSLERKPDWAMAVRHLAWYFGSIQSRVHDYLYALELGEVQRSREAASDIGQSVEMALENVSTIPLLESPVCAAALERIAASVNSLNVPDPADLNEVMKFIERNYQ